MIRRIPRYRRPPLLLVVCGACVMVSLISGVALAALVGSQLSAAGLTATMTADRTLIRDFVTRQITDSDLLAPIDQARRASLSGALATLLAPGEIQSATILDTSGQVIAVAGAGTQTGGSLSTGTTSPRIVISDGPTAVITEDLPVVLDGTPRATVQLRRDGNVLRGAVDAARAAVVIVLVAAGALLSALLVVAFQTSQALLTRQADALIESARRDRLTGLPSHGTVVSDLTTLVAEARRDGGWLVVALLDIDGFDLFNTTHGHEVGDSALHEMARVLDEEAPSGALVGRYGPDEFMLAAPPGCAAEIRPAIVRIQERLRDVQVGMRRSARIPITISAGIATYPEHAGSVSELLAAATMMLREAKVSGGDTVRVDAPADVASAAELRNFSVLQGLVTAVDTKDHYTKRHSEEVAHFAIAIARRLGLDSTFVASVQQAGLLHDVGKIGVPDAILRKPGPLSPEEEKVVQQHAVIGDLIIGGVPEMEFVRAGVRHHHERWDGNGYPDRLRGEETPRIARIVAVADTFSAMTTSRTYRVGLPIAEAIRRLADAAGNQLDPQCVAVFVELLLERPDIVAAEGDPTPARLWTASDAVA